MDSTAAPDAVVPATSPHLQRLLDVSSLYDLSDEALQARLAALVASIASSVSAGSQQQAQAPPTLDQFLSVERELLLIHAELRERHLSAQLARDPWMDSELDDVRPGQRDQIQRDVQREADELERQAQQAREQEHFQQQQPSNAAPTSGKPAQSPVAAAAVSADEARWLSNQHGDRRALEEVRRRAGGPHGPVRAAVVAPTTTTANHRPNAASATTAAKMRLGGGKKAASASGLSIPESILNQRREMVVMTSDNRKPTAAAAPGASSSTAGAPKKARSRASSSGPSSPTHGLSSRSTTSIASSSSASSVASSPPSSSGAAPTAGGASKRSASTGASARSNSGAGRKSVGGAAVIPTVPKGGNHKQPQSVSEKAKHTSSAKRASTKPIGSRPAATSASPTAATAVAGDIHTASDLVEDEDETVLIQLAPPPPPPVLAPAAAIVDADAGTSNAVSPSADVDADTTSRQHAVADTDAHAETEVDLDLSSGSLDDSVLSDAGAAQVAHPYASMDHEAIAGVQRQAVVQALLHRGAAPEETLAESVSFERSARSRSRSRSPTQPIPFLELQQDAPVAPAAAPGTGHGGDDDARRLLREAAADPHATDEDDDERIEAEYGEDDEYDGSARAAAAANGSAEGSFESFSSGDLLSEAAWSARSGTGSDGQGPTALQSKLRRLQLGGGGGAGAATGGPNISAAQLAKAAALGDTLLDKLKRKQARSNATATPGAATKAKEKPSAASSKQQQPRPPKRIASDPRREAERAVARLRNRGGIGGTDAASAEGQTGEHADIAASTTVPKKASKSKTASKVDDETVIILKRPTAAGGGARAPDASPSSGRSESSSSARADSEQQAPTALVPSRPALAAKPRPPPRPPSPPPIPTHAYELFFPSGALEYMFGAMWLASSSSSSSGSSSSVPGGGTSSAANVGSATNSNWFSSLVTQMAQVEKFRAALMGGGGGTTATGDSNKPARVGSARSGSRGSSRQADEVRLEYLSGANGSSAPFGNATGLQHAPKLSYGDAKMLEQSRLMKAQRLLQEGSTSGCGAADLEPSSSPSPSPEPLQPPSASDDALVAREGLGLGLGGLAGGRSNSSSNLASSSSSPASLTSSAALVFLVTREREEVYNVVRRALMQLKDEESPPQSDTAAATSLTSATDNTSPLAPGALNNKRRFPLLWTEAPADEAPRPDKLFPFLPPNFTSAVVGSTPASVIAPTTAAPALPLYATPPSVVAAEKAAAIAAAAAAAAAASTAMQPLHSPGGTPSPSPSAGGVSFSEQSGQFHTSGGGAGVGGALAPHLSSLRAAPPLYWNLLWTWKKPHLEWGRLLAWQKVNHFPDSRVLTRKDLLKKALERFSLLKGFRHRGEWGDVMPQSFILPQEFQPFAESFTKTAMANEQAQARAEAQGQAQPQGELNYWICKPPSLSRGRGIFVTDRLADIDIQAPLLVQRYITNPLLLNGFKWDLRLYALVTSVEPLEAFVYREGFARLSTTRFSAEASSLKNRFIHLTNSSVQKNNILTREGKEIGGAGVGDHARAIAKEQQQQQQQANPTGDPRFDRAASASSSSTNGGKSSTGKQTLEDTVFQDPIGEGGSKISLAYLWTLLRARGIDTDALWQRIVRLLLLTLVAVEDSIVPCVSSFELFGFDVLIDSDLRPHLIEVNASPSMGLDTPLDEAIKPRLIRDAVNLVAPLPTNRVFLEHVLARRAKTGHFEPSVPKSREKKVIAANQVAHHLLCGERPRLVGEMPARLGLFQRIAPATPTYEAVMRMKRAAFQPTTNAEHKHKRTLPAMT